MISVSEIFKSIQGEGPNTGQPSVFLRTAGCNLDCSWCDTDYAKSKKKAKKMSIEDIVQEIDNYNAKNLVITGGEPLLQQKSLKKLIEQLDDYYIELETNGSIACEFDELINQYNCSPKLLSSGNDEYELQILPSEKTWYKFVIDEESDFFKAIEFAGRYGIPQDRVLMMPQGKTKKECEHNSLWLVEKCNETGYSFCPRLHVMLWNNQRGK